MNRIVQRLLSAGAALTILVSGMGTPVWAIESGSPTSSISDMESLPAAAANFINLVEKLPKEGSGPSQAANLHQRPVGLCEGGGRRREKL